MNIELLQKVRNLIAENGNDHFDMQWWIHKKGDDALLMEEDGEVAICGTTMCIGGWTMIAGGKGKVLAEYSSTRLIPQSGERNIDPQKEAAELLGIDYQRSWGLFFVTDWPMNYRTMENRYEATLLYLDDIISGKVEF